MILESTNATADLSTISDGKQFDAFLRKSSFKIIADTIMEGIVILDTDLHIHYFNKAAEVMTGLVHDYVHDKKINDVLKLHSAAGTATLDWPIQDVMKQGRSHSQVSEHRLELRDNVVPITYSVSPIRSDDGVVMGATLVFRDVSEEKELIRLKSEFVSVVSHQLRTPASAVKWYLETLIDNRHGLELNEWQIDKLEQSYQSNERMIQLVNDLLNVSRLDAGKVDINVAPLNMKQLFLEVERELTHFAHAHNVEIKNTMPDGLPTVLADISKIREVLVNFMSNAIKYTRSGHHSVTVSAAVEGEMVKFSIQDEGIGIPEKDISHIAKKFFRADNAIESQTEGSGLGLYIAYQIIHLHRGEIQLESVEQEGTTVHFTLPINNT